MNKILLSVPQPCHENWEGMSPREQGKFCGACKKTVVDFSAMSDRQLAEFFKKPTGHLCGRFHQDQLTRGIDLATAPKRIPWLRYFFQITIPAFLFSMKATAQGRVKVQTDSVKRYSMTLGIAAIKKEPTEIVRNKVIRGSVLDKNGSPAPFATIHVSDDRKKATMSDTAGKFSIEVGHKEVTVLEVSAVGYETCTVAAPDGMVTVVMKTRTMEYLGVVVVVPVRKKKPIPLITKIMDTAFRKFSVYPNPAPRNSEIRIEMRSQEAGAYTVSIIDMAGLVVQTDEVRLEEKGQVVKLQLKETAAGTYLVHLFNRQTAASYTEKILVQ